MEVGTRLYLGFAALIAIALLLGGLAVWQMAHVGKDTSSMAKAYMPPVVADEVRNLAQRAAQAAKETAAKIEDSVQKSAQGADISSKVATSMDF